MIWILSISKAVASNEPAFEFRADHAPAREVARAIGEHFKISVFTSEKVGDKPVSGYLREGSLETALDTLAFFTGSSWRKTAGAIYLGDDEKESFFALPSAGLDAAAIKAIFPQSVLAGDRVILKARPADYAQLRGVIEGMQSRKQLRLRILICDVGGSFRDPLNSFLGTAKIQFNATGDLLRGGLDFKAPLSITDVYQFLKEKTDVRIKTFTDYVLVSGESAKLTAGNVLERQIFVRPTEAIDGTGNTLVTRFDRLQLGLTVELRAFAYDGRWFLRYDVQDADFQNNTERRTASVSSVEITDHTPVKVVSLDRDRATDSSNEVKGLARLPVVGRIFRSRGEDKEKRVLYVLVQWLPDGGPELEPGASPADRPSASGSASAPASSGAGAEAMPQSQT